MYSNNVELGPHKDEPMRCNGFGDDVDQVTLTENEAHI